MKAYLSLDATGAPELLLHAENTTEDTVLRLYGSLFGAVESPTCLEWRVAARLDTSPNTVESP